MVEANPTLTDIQNRLERIERHLVGNGREGLLQNMSRLDERVNDLETTRTNFADRIWSAVLTAAFIIYGVMDKKG